MLAAVPTFDPLVPMQETVAGPTAAEPEAANVISVVPPVAATGLVAYVDVTPVGSPVQDGTIPAKRLEAVYVAVVDVDALWENDADDEESAVVSTG